MATNGDDGHELARAGHHHAPGRGRCAPVLAAVRQPQHRRSYTGVLDRPLGQLGADRPLAEVRGEDLAELLERLWGQRAPATFNRNRAAVSAWLTWCATNRLPAPSLPPGVERRREPTNATRAVPRAAIERALSRRDVPLRERTLWRMLSETAARVSEVLALNIQDLDLDARRAPIRSKGGDTEWIHWGSGTAHLLPRLLRGREAGPVFVSVRRPGPTRRPGAKDLCPTTGRARLGYDRARVLFTRHTGWELHQLRHSAATHLGEQGVAPQLRGRPRSQVATLWASMASMVNIVSAAISTISTIVPVSAGRHFAPRQGNLG